MLDWFANANPVLQATLAGVFTWLMTTLGSALVFFFNDINRRVLDIMNGFAAGVMIAASFWSLLAPSIEASVDAGWGRMAFFPALVGFLVGGLFLRGIDYITPHLHMGKNRTDAEGPKTKLPATTLLFLAVTIHNIPEGLSVGVGFGAQELGLSSLASAMVLTMGIGLQNFPEGAALSMPIRAEGASKWRAFQLGQASALVEIVGAAIGALLVSQVTVILPYALAFAAGAMIFVCVEQLIPESQSHGNSDIATIALLVGFGVMMTLDVALG